LIEYIIIESSEDEFKRGHKYPFVSCELLNCDVPKFLDFFTLTEAERVEKDRKTSSVDSELGISDSINSQNEINSWNDKKEGSTKKIKNLDNPEKFFDNLQEKSESLIDEEERDKNTDDACEVINPDNLEEKEYKELKDKFESNINLLK